MELESGIQEHQLLSQDKEFKLELLLRYTRAKGWVYFGGHEYKTSYDKDGFHNIRFHRLWPDYFDKEPFIHHSDYCVCGTGIVQQCYIYNIYTKEIVVVGNCCILKWKLQGMPCSMCFEPHLNRKDNYCSPCRIVRKKKEDHDKQVEALIEYNRSRCIEDGCSRKRCNSTWGVRCKSCYYKRKNSF